MPSGFPATPEACLRRAAGEGAFTRGRDYWKTGRVELLTSTPGKALARVRGTEMYLVELRCIHGRIEGRCECPAFEDSAFCKHMVAVALAAPEAAIDVLDALRTWLLTQPAEALAERLLRRAEHDDELRRELERERGDATEDDAALIARYRKDIEAGVDAAREPRSWQAPNDFAELRTVIRGLARLASSRPAAILELAVDLLDAICELSGEVDDSEGELFALGEQVLALHLELCGALRPEPAALAKKLLAWELDGVTDLFHAAHEDYVDVLGPAGVTALAGEARRTWAGLPAPKPHEFDTRRSVIKRILDRFDARDLDARIALRKAELTTPYGYREIAHLLEEAGRNEEALKWLEEALWVFEDRPDRALQEDAARLMHSVGRAKDAQNLRWSIFAKDPTILTYRALVEVSGAPSRSNEAKALLRARAEEHKVAGAFWIGPAASLFDILFAEGEFDATWAVAEDFEVGERLGYIADRTVDSHRDHALAAYRKLAEQRIKAGGAGNYDEAMKWIRKRASANPDPVDQAAWIEDLRLRHKAKRTFIQRLEAPSR